jgi:hypothetical protein
MILPEFVDPTSRFDFGLSPSTRAAPPARPVCTARRRATLVLLFVALVGAATLSGLRLLEHPDREAVPGAPTDAGSTLALRKPADRGPVHQLSSASSERAAPPATSAAESWGRRIVRRAQLDLELGDVDDGVARLTALIESLGGFVGSTDTQTDAKGTARATITAYVPAAEFARALTGVDGVGRVTRREIAGQDVSEEFVDLEARIRNLQRHEAQLLSFMGKAQKVTDLLALETEMARLRGEIERATGRLRFLGARTDLATIQAGLVRAPLAAPVGGRLARSAEQARQALVESWSTALGVALGAGVLAAQLSPLAVVALLGWLGYCWWARRRPTPADG